MNILCGFQKDFPNYVDWILRLIMKNKAAAIIANIFIAFMITSCSNGGLSRDEASNPIKKALSEKNPLDLILLGGFNGTWGWTECRLHAVMSSAAQSAALGALEKEGFVATRYEKNNIKNWTNTAKQICSITEIGKRELVWSKKENNSYELKLGSYVLDEVTGIQISEKENSARATFSFRIEPNNAGNAVLGAIEKHDSGMFNHMNKKLSSSGEGVAHFAKYDDGWRIESLDIRSVRTAAFKVQESDPAEIEIQKSTADNPTKNVMATYEGGWYDDGDWYAYLSKGKNGSTYNLKIWFMEGSSDNGFSAELKQLRNGNFATSDLNLVVIPKEKRKLGMILVPGKLTDKNGNPLEQGWKGIFTKDAQVKP